MVSIIEPWTVIRGEDEQGILFQTMFAQGLHDLPDRPVDLHHDVPEQTGPALALELLRDVKRDVDHAMRDVDEKGIVLVLLDKGNRPVGILGGELLLVFARDRGVDHLVSVDQRQVGPALETFLHGQVQDTRVVRPHIVRVGQPEVIVEPMLHRQKFL